MEFIMHKDFDMTLGAIAAMVLDYAAVAFVIGLLVFDRWLGIRRGITLDTILVLIAALGVAAWFAGSRLRHRIVDDTSVCPDGMHIPDSNKTGTHDYE
jgi:hypothetical protein